MLIAHVSDFHVSVGPPETSLVRPDAEAAARKVVADILAADPPVDAVCLTGDLVDTGTAADYALLGDILAPIRVPVFVVPGNHDRRATLRAAFSDRLDFAADTTLHYEARLGSLRILALDTLVEGQVAGRLDPAQLAWLERKLALVSDGPTLLLMHHPAFPSGIRGLDAMSLIEGGARLGELVRAYRGDLRILSGHIHRPFHGIWNGAFCAVSGSPAFQVRLDLDPSAPEPGTVDEPFAYFIHRLDGAGTLSVHTRYLSL